MKTLLALAIVLSAISQAGAAYPWSPQERPANDAAEQDAPLESATEADISGFIIDNTITRAGHDFARYLADARRLNFPDAAYNLTVRERPSARWGNLVWVENEGKTVYRQFLQLRAGNVQEVAEQAAAFIHEEVQRVKLRALLADDFDLAKDEF